MNCIIVTGAGSGIGKAVSKILYHNNLTPILVGQTESKLKTLSQELNQAPFLTLKVEEENSILKLSKFLKNLGEGVQLQGLINNAGIYKPSSFLKSTQNEWLEQFKVNTLGPLNLSKACIPFLEQTQGYILNISSTLGLRPIENTAAYSASKAALNSLTQTMALELAPLNIKVNAICPGIVDTPIHKVTGTRQEWKAELKNMQPLGRIGTPEDIAQMVLSFISSPSQWLTGTLLPIDGGILLKS